MNTKIFLWTSAAIFLLFSLFSVIKPLCTDEVEIPAAAYGISTTGKPIYFMGDHLPGQVGEKDQWIFEATPVKGHQYAVWHTNLYLHILAFFYLIFGTSDAVIRGVGLLFLLIDLFILRKIIFEVWPSEGQKIFETCAVLFFLNPLILQIAMLPDLDNTAMTAACLLFLYQYLKLQSKTGWRKILLLSLLFALAAWAKELALLYLSSVVVAYEVCNRKWKRLGEGILISVLGTFLLATTWYLYCRFTDSPPDYILKFSYFRRTGGGLDLITDIANQKGSAAAMLSLAKTLTISLIWASPFFFLCALLGLKELMRDWKENSKVRLIILFVAMFFVITKILRPSLITMKYEFPAYGFLTILAAVWICRNLSVLIFSRMDRILLVLAGATALQYFLLGDPVLNFVQNGFGSFLLAFLVLPVVLVFTFRMLFKEIPLAFGVIAASLLATQLALGIAQTEPYNTTGPWLALYGEEGQKKTQVHLNETLKPGETLFARKDVGFWLQRQRGPDFRWVDSYFLRNPLSESELENFLPSGSVLTIDRTSYSSETIALLKKRFKVTLSSGDFIVAREL